MIIRQPTSTTPETATCTTNFHRDCRVNSPSAISLWPLFPVLHYGNCLSNMRPQELWSGRTFRGVFHLLRLYIYVQLITSPCTCGNWPNVNDPKLFPLTITNG